MSRSCTSAGSVLEELSDHRDVLANRVLAVFGVVRQQNHLIGGELRRGTVPMLARESREGGAVFQVLHRHIPPVLHDPSHKRGTVLVLNGEVVVDEAAVVPERRGAQAWQI